MNVAHYKVTQARPASTDDVYVALKTYQSSSLVSLVQTQTEPWRSWVDGQALAPSGGLLLYRMGRASKLLGEAELLKFQLDNDPHTDYVLGLDGYFCLAETASQAGFDPILVMQSIKTENEAAQDLVCDFLAVYRTQLYPDASRWPNLYVLEDLNLGELESPRQLQQILDHLPDVFSEQFNLKVDYLLYPTLNLDLLQTDFVETLAGVEQPWGATGAEAEYPAGFHAFSLSPDREIQAQDGLGRWQTIKPGSSAYDDLQAWLLKHRRPSPYQHIYQTDFVDLLDALNWCYQTYHPDTASWVLQQEREIMEAGFVPFYDASVPALVYKF